MRRCYPCVLFLLIVSWCFAQDAVKTATKTPARQTAATNGDDNTLINENPVTVKTNGDSKKPADTDPVFGVPPLPQGKTSLVGGKVTNIDGVHNKLGVKVFEGGKWTVAFDERTHFYVDGSETTFEKVKKGDRVYVDTMLDNHRIFARNVHVITKAGHVADARGQVTAFDNGVITLRDELSARPVQFRVDSQTQVKRDGATASAGEIHPGSLVTVLFTPDNNGGGVAREITVLAGNGQSFTFAGRVRHLDLRNNQLAIENDSDNKTYEIALDGETLPSNLMVGSDVTVAAVFDGRQYVANSISVK